MIGDDERRAANASADATADKSADEWPLPPPSRSNAFLLQGDFDSDDGGDVGDVGDVGDIGCRSLACVLPVEELLLCFSFENKKKKKENLGFFE